MAEKTGLERLRDLPKITQRSVAEPGFEHLISEPEPLSVAKVTESGTAESSPKLLAMVPLRFVFLERTGPPTQDSTEPQVVAR